MLPQANIELELTVDRIERRRRAGEVRVVERIGHGRPILSPGSRARLKNCPDRWGFAVGPVAPHEGPRVGRGVERGRGDLPPFFRRGRHHVRVAMARGAIDIQRFVQHRLALMLMMTRRT